MCPFVFGRIQSRARVHLPSFEYFPDYGYKRGRERDECEKAHLTGATLQA